MLFSRCISAYGADDSAARLATFNALYAKLKVVMNSGNVGVVDAMLAPGFHSENVTGKIHLLAQVFEQITDRKEAPNMMSATQLVTAVLDGGTAKVVQQNRLTTSKSFVGNACRRTGSRGGEARMPLPD